jgi:hypothetical protein
MVIFFVSSKEVLMDITQIFFIDVLHSLKISTCEKEFYIIGFSHCST